jgi:hypothetical protein
MADKQPDAPSGYKWSDGYLFDLTGRKLSASQTRQVLALCPANQAKRGTKGQQSAERAKLWKASSASGTWSASSASGTWSASSAAGAWSATSASGTWGSSQWSSSSWKGATLRAQRGVIEEQGGEEEEDDREKAVRLQVWWRVEKTSNPEFLARVEIVEESLRKCKSNMKGFRSQIKEALGINDTATIREVGKRMDKYLQRFQKECADFKEWWEREKESSASGTSDKPCPANPGSRQYKVTPSGHHYWIYDCGWFEEIVDEAEIEAAVKEASLRRQGNSASGTCKEEQQEETAQPKGTSAAGTCKEEVEEEEEDEEEEEEEEEDEEEAEVEEEGPEVFLATSAKSKAKSQQKRRWADQEDDATKMATKAKPTHEVDLGPDSSDDEDMLQKGGLTNKRSQDSAVGTGSASGTMRGNSVQEWNSFLAREGLEEKLAMRLAKLLAGASWTIEMVEAVTDVGQGSWRIKVVPSSLVQGRQDGSAASSTTWHFQGFHATTLSGAKGIAPDRKIRGTLLQHNGRSERGVYCRLTMNPKSPSDLVSLFRDMSTHGHNQCHLLWEVKTFCTDDARKVFGGVPGEAEAICTGGAKITHFKSSGANRYCIREDYVSIAALWVEPNALEEIDVGVHFDF